FNTVTSVFYFVFLFASSMFYPIEPLPDAFRMAALINPITWQVDVLRYATIGYGTAGQIAIEGVAFIVFSLISFALAQQALWKQE
ncbi:MAG TPA: ABC transporter permease, partial [Vicinamibacterales bacterium]